MSNPSKPRTDKVTKGETDLYVLPESSFRYPDNWKEHKKLVSTIPNIQSRLKGLDMDIENTIVVPKEWTVDDRVLKTDGDAYAKTKTEPASHHNTTEQSYKFRKAFFQELPADTQAVAKINMEKTVFFEGGAQWTLGRLEQYYPKAKSTVSVPFSMSEARVAIRNSGIFLDQYPKDFLRPYPLVVAEGEEEKKGLRINKDASNGLPVGGKWTDDPARRLVMQLAVNMRAELREASKNPNGVWHYVRMLESTQPWRIASTWKCKGDYATYEKMIDQKLRGYVVLGRQTALNIQVASQPFGHLKRNILNSESFSAQGVTFTHGGADALVHKLEYQLQTDGFFWVTCGDDSLVGFRAKDERLIIFALDCRSYDITHHNVMTKPFHLVLREELRKIDACAADLWFALARERVVNMAGTQVRRMRHASPSGIPLVPYVNDAVMQATIARVLRGCSALEHEDRFSVGEVIESVGKAVGLVVSIEQYYEGQHSSLFDAIRQQPLLFLGYNLHMVGTKVYPEIDIPRMLGQIAAPRHPHIKESKKFKMFEAMRIGSIFLGAGYPQRKHVGAFLAAEDYVTDMISEVVDKYKDSPLAPDELAFAVDNNPLGPEPILSLEGLLKAIKQPRKELWGAPEENAEAPPPRPSYDAPGIPEMGISWADMVDKAEEDERELLGLPPHPVGDPRIPKLVAPYLGQAVPRVRTHPPTIANDGRPPPTAHWLPDKPKRATTEGYAGRKVTVRYGAVGPGEDYIEAERFADYEEQYDQDDKEVYDEQGEAEEIDEEEYYDRMRLRIAKIGR